MMFGKLIEQMETIGHRCLADSRGDYLEAEAPPVRGLLLRVDRNLQQNGPDGIFLTGQAAITWLVKDLPTANRGAYFVIGCTRYRVDDIARDDGYEIMAITTPET